MVSTDEERHKDVLSLFVGNSSARAKKHTGLVIAGLGVSTFESSSHNPEGFEGAPPVAESSDRRSWAGTWVCANNVQRKALVPTRTVGSSVRPRECKRCAAGAEWPNETAENSV